MERFLNESATYVESVYAESTIGGDEGEHLERDHQWVEEQQQRYGQYREDPLDNRTAGDETNIPQQHDHYSERESNLEDTLSQQLKLLNQMVTSKDDQILALQNILQARKSKYEALAKLYSQLRLEHLDTLRLYKSAEEKIKEMSVDQRNLQRSICNLERDLEASELDYDMFERDVRARDAKTSEKYKTLEKTCSQLTAENQGLQERLAGAAANEAGMTMKYQALCSQLEVVATDLKARFEKVRGDLAESSQKSQVLQSLNLQLASESRDLQQVLDNANSSMTSTHGILEQQVKELTLAMDKIGRVQW